MLLYNAFFILYATFFSGPDISNCGTDTVLLLDVGYETGDYTGQDGKRKPSKYVTILRNAAIVGIFKDDEWMPTQNGAIVCITEKGRYELLRNKEYRIKKIITRTKKGFMSTYDSSDISVKIEKK